MSGESPSGPHGYFSLTFLVITAWALVVADNAVPLLEFIYPGAKDWSLWGWDALAASPWLKFGYLIVAGYGLAAYRLRGLWLLLPALVEIYQLYELGKILTQGTS